MADKPAEDGFEHQGTFYRWHVSDMGKDLMLIDRFSGLPVAEFFETVEDNFDRGRAPILLTLVATSIRNGHPDWSLERVIRTVMDLNLSELTFLEADTEEDTLPPASAAETASTGNRSSSPSRSPSSDPGPVRSETSNATPA